LENTKVEVVQNSEQKIKKKLEMEGQDNKKIINITQNNMIRD